MKVQKFDSEDKPSAKLRRFIHRYDRHAVKRECREIAQTANRILKGVR